MCNGETIAYTPVIHTDDKLPSGVFLHGVALLKEVRASHHQNCTGVAWLLLAY